MAKCIICGDERTAWCSKCKATVCHTCHKPANQEVCEICLEKLPSHKTGCYNGMRFSYLKSSGLPITYHDLMHKEITGTKTLKKSGDE